MQKYNKYDQRKSSESSEEKTRCKSATDVNYEDRTPG